MAYSADTFTSLEQPTLAKWNKLWANDAYFNTQVGANFSSGTTSTVWWEELGRHTLGGTATSMSVASLPSRKFLKVIFTCLPSGSIGLQLRFNNDSGANYSYRNEQDNAASTAGTSTSAMSLGLNTGTYQVSGEFTVINISSMAKPSWGMSNTMTELASAAPSSTCFWNKWANTSTVISRIDILTSTNNFASGSSMVVLGHD